MHIRTLKSVFTLLEFRNARILLVVFTERGDTARIISAREATTREQKYDEANQIY